MRKLRQFVLISLLAAASQGLPAPGFARLVWVVPEQLDLSPDFPPPGDQGQQSSTAGWAVSYARSYYTKKFEARDNRSPENIPSPAYVYSSIAAKSSCLGEAPVVEALQLLQAGSVSLKEFPYDANVCRQPSQELRSKAVDFRIRGFSQLATPIQVDKLKHQLVRGLPVILELRATKNFEHLGPGQTYSHPSENEVGYILPVVVVGYDDRRSAFKLLNSWGRNWGTDGYGWIAYDLVGSEVRRAHMMNVLTDDDADDSKMPFEAERPPRGSLYILSIGVSQSNDQSGCRPYASSDAVVVAEALAEAGKSLHEVVRAAVLSDETATKKAVAQEFRKIAQTAKAEDTFVLFMSGYGLSLNNSFHFALSNVKSEKDLRGSAAVSLDDLHEWLKPIKAGQKLIAVDANESGSTVRLAGSEGTVVIAATSEHYAQDGYKGHGLFTSLLLDSFAEADTNADGLIDTIELAAYLNRRVQEMALSLRHRVQVPAFGMIGPAFSVVSQKDADGTATDPK